MDELSGLKIGERTSKDIRSKVLSILKRFQQIHRERNATGQGDIPGAPRLRTMYRFDDLERICGSRVVDPLHRTLVTAGEGNCSN